MKTYLATLCMTIILTVGSALAAPVASVVAVRGKATIERGGKQIEARPKMEIEQKDTIATAAGGRVKLLFIDDSVLTLAEKSRMNVDTFLHSRTDRGKSLFNLLDGKMRAVVGKTRFEVKTPTVVAAARGTIILFETGILNGQPFTRITCLEGIVDVRALTAGPGIPPVMLAPGQTIVVTTGQPIPAPTQLSPAELNKLKQDTSTTGGEITLPDAKPVEMGGVVLIPIQPPIQPPLNTQQQKNKVNIGIKF